MRRHEEIAAKRAVEEFVEAVIAKEWEGAVKATQPSWRNSVEEAKKDPALEIERIFHSLGVTSFQLGRVRRVRMRPNPPSKVMLDVETVLETDRLGTLKTLVRVIRENEDGRPVVKGEANWRANPVSALRMSVVNDEG